MVIVLICNKGLICDVNEIQETNEYCCLSALLSIVITYLCPILVVDSCVLQPSLPLPRVRLHM
jgi:hypothetical protein